MDNKLFELCKAVYEKTGWNDLSNDAPWYTKHGVVGYKRLGIAPLYTSDYLLDKLPRYILVYKTATYERGKTIETVFRTESNQTANEVFYSDTPLKALLKLTLALAEAGELPINNKDKA